jgi:hypothetical protein
MIAVIFTLLSAIYDNGKRFEDHSSRFIFRAIVVAVISYFSNGNVILNFALNTAIFYLIFDYTLNTLEGRNWNYIGATAEIDIIKGKIEKIIPYFDLTSKLLFLTTTIYLKCQYNF